MQKNDNIDPMLTKIFSERLDHCKKAHIKKCKDKKFSLSHGVKNTGNDDEHGDDNNGDAGGVDSWKDEW